MQLDFSGQVPVQEPLPVRLYADEIKPCQNRLGEHWMYIGLLSIPETRYKDVLGWLAQDRATAGYEGEVHFADSHYCSTARAHNKKMLLAKLWVERVMWDSEKVFHFYLLGLNLEMS